MDQRSPLESIFSVIGGLPQGHDKPVKHAVYNAVALFLLFLCSAATYAVYMILQPFIKPLMWAVLVGSALHPLKRSLQYRFQRWIRTLETANTPVVLGVILLPANIFNYVSDFIGEILWKRLKLIVGVCIVFTIMHILYFYTPKTVIMVIWRFAQTSFSTMNLLLDNSSIWMFLLLVIGYLTTVFFLWQPENNTKFHYVSIAIWLYCSCCVAGLFGRIQMPIFILLQFVFFGGFLSEVYEIYQTMSKAGEPISITEALSLAFHDKPIELDDSSDSCADKEKYEDVSNPDEKVEPKEKVNKVTFDEKCDTPKSCGDVVKNDRAREENPWEMELFEEKPVEKKSEPELKSSILLTSKGIHVIQDDQPSSVKHFLTKSTKVKQHPILKRSLSQPHFFTNNPKLHKATILSLSRKLSRSHSITDSDESYESSFYLYSVLWACVIMLFWRNIMLLPLLPVPIFFYLIKHVGIYLGLWSYLYEKFLLLFETVSNWCEERHDALVPVPIRGLYRFVHRVNMILKASIEGSIDTVASCVVIFGLIVFLICGSIFIALQIYAEAIMLVQMTGNVINQTVVNNPELKQLLPPAWDDTVDSILDNAYLYGREGISKAVKGMMSDVDSAKSAKLEKQVLELWDRVYQSWMSNNESNGPKVTDEAVRTSWEGFINDIQKSPEMFNLNGIMDFAKQNIGTLMSLLESIWSILIGNISLILGSCSTFLSVILGGGTAVLNFLLNVVVFLTTLFYLLNSSGDLYKPVEILTNFSPSSRRFGHALEGAVNGVFFASLRMASFYGLWTWFIHNLFSVRIVYLPSAFATIFGAIPFLGTYWACIPAVLDLWLAQDRSIAAIMIAVFQFLPTNVVDTIIYKEIKGGGHPYLTGLAIAGGIFCLGVEGAIIGPMLLCGLYVAMDLSSSLFQESPSETSLNLRLH